MTMFAQTDILEDALERAQAGQIPMPDFLRLFSDAEIYVPSGAEVMSDGSGFRPVLFDKEGVQMVACATSMERIGALAGMAPYCLSIKGKEFLRLMPPGYGLVVNPGHTLGFEVSPQGLERIVEDFASA